MLLTKNDSVTLTASSVSYPVSVTEPFKAEASVSTGYTDITSLTNWCLFGMDAYSDYSSFRNMLISDFEPTWGTLSDPDKRILVDHYVYPSETTTIELDGLFTKTERDICLNKTSDKLNLDGYNMVRSKDNSDVYFEVRPNSVGSLVVTKLLTDVVMS